MRTHQGPVSRSRWEPRLGRHAAAIGPRVNADALPRAMSRQVSLPMGDSFNAVNANLGDVKPLRPTRMADLQLEYVQRLRALKAVDEMLDALGEWCVAGASVGQGPCMATPAFALQASRYGGSCRRPQRVRHLRDALGRMWTRQLDSLTERGFSLSYLFTAHCHARLPKDARGLQPYFG